MTQLLSVRSWRPELGARQELSGRGVWPENRGPPLRPAICPSPCPGLRKRSGVFQRRPKNCFLQESRGPARASSKDASGAARWKPMLPGRPLRAGRDCESPCSRLVAILRFCPNSVSPPTPRSRRASKFLRHPRRAAQRRPGPTSRRGYYGLQAGATGRGGGIRPARGPESPEARILCLPGPECSGQDSGGRWPGPVIADMCRGQDAGPERRPLERAPVVTPGAPWPHVGLCCRLPRGKKSALGPNGRRWGKFKLSSIGWGVGEHRWLPSVSSLPTPYRVETIISHPRPLPAGLGGTLHALVDPIISSPLQGPSSPSQAPRGTPEPDTATFKGFESRCRHL